ncbi:MAG: trigger factor [bacterium]|nr:trigger factor [bacterium]
MKSSIKKLPGSKIELEVSLDQKEFQVYWDQAYQQALSGVQLKGFRPGTAPKEMADRAVDKDKVFNDAANQAVRQSLDELSEENNWTFIDQPQIEVTSSADLSLKYKATLAVFPEVELVDYKKIAKKIFSDKKETVVDDKEIADSLEWLRGSRAKVVSVDREAHKGDVVDVDLESEVDSFKGEKFILGQAKFLPGFEEQIENHKAGENLEFSLKAPDDYWNTKLRGKEINFKVKLNQVFERELPELNDELAQALGPNFKTVDDIKKNIADGLKQEKETKEKDRLRAKTLDEVIKASKIELPDIMIARTLDKMVQDYKQNPALAKVVSGKSDDELKAQLKERARNNVLGNLVIYKIAELENLLPTKEEVENELKLLSSQSGRKIDGQQYYDYSYGVIQNRKVFEFLESQVN